MHLAISARSTSFGSLVVARNSLSMTLREWGRSASDSASCLSTADGSKVGWLLRKCRKKSEPA